MHHALRQHWPEYLMEAAGLGTLVISASVFIALLEYPDSPVHRAVVNDSVRLTLNGLAMGLTAIGIMYSPRGARSGAHIQELSRKRGRTNRCRQPVTLCWTQRFH